MAGYGVMLREVHDELGVPPTHVFVQAGVGGLAAATAAALRQLWREASPRVVVVEPMLAACLFESARLGRPSAVDVESETVMAGLSCGEVSHLAWPILRSGADAMMRIDDEAVPAAMRLLAQAPYGDRPIVGGESGVAGLAGFLAVAGKRQARETLGLNADSRVLLFGSEGDTDSQTYARYVGRTGAEVRQSAKHFTGGLS